MPLSARLLAASPVARISAAPSGKNLRNASSRRFPKRQSGATLVEFIVVAPTLAMLLLGMMQYATLFHAKSNLNYATFEAARAGSVHHAKPDEIHAAFTRAMTGYYGGGTTATELASAYAKAQADLNAGTVRIEILSPTKESFDDYHSPALASKLNQNARVIPNANLAFIKCPYDNPGCANDPAKNQSGQTLLDANLLKLRVTYGVPETKQMPLVGRFYTYALSVVNASDPDAFKKALIANGRIPVVTHTTMRMQSPAIEVANASLPGPGNQGKPQDPGPGAGGGGLPPCPASDPTCKAEPGCDPATDPAGCRPPGCAQGTASCDPGCGKNYCCTPDQGSVNPDGTPVNPTPDRSASNPAPDSGNAKPEPVNPPPIPKSP